MEITSSILVKNGFQSKERILGLPVTYSVWTNDEHPYKLDVVLNAEHNNTIKNHYVHIDNGVCSSVGNLEFDTIEQFNFLMKALGLKFCLNDK